MGIEIWFAAPRIRAAGGDPWARRLRAQGPYEPRDQAQDSKCLKPIRASGARLMIPGCPWSKQIMILKRFWHHKWKKFGFEARPSPKQRKKKTVFLKRALGLDPKTQRSCARSPRAPKPQVLNGFFAQGAQPRVQEPKAALLAYPTLILTADSVYP